MIKSFFELLVEIFFPYFCVGCQKYDTLLCCDCYEKIIFVNNQPKLKENIKYLDEIISICEFNDVVKQIIYQLKYKSVKDLSLVSAEIIYRAANIPKSDYITFVPLHKQKRKTRGFNQSREIATTLSDLTNIELLPLLTKTKQTKSQMSVSNKELRSKNLEGCFEVINSVDKKQIKDKTILIVDDVFTTGSTLNECAKILKKLDVKKIIGITLVLK